MIIKLLPEQIANYWDTIEYGVSRSLPPTVVQSVDEDIEKGRLNKTLTSLLTGVLECWVSFDYSEDKKKLKFIMITQLIYDDILETRNLFIYSLYGFTQIDKETWLSAFQHLLDYGEQKNCAKLFAFSAFNHLKEMAKKFGGSSDYSLIEFDIGGKYGRK